MEIKELVMTTDITEIVIMLKTQRFRGGQVFVCGNGGSASTAEHFTNDLFSRGIRAVCLNNNVSIMTMIANDFGYEYVFQKQLEVYADPNDLVIAFSVSGTSKNIIALERLSFIMTITIFGRPGETPQVAENRHFIFAHEIANQL